MKDRGNRPRRKHGALSFGIFVSCALCAFVPNALATGGNSPPSTPPTAVDADLDSDGDGLINSEEAEVGTKPDVPDSDGDGVLDGEDACPLDEDFEYKKRPLTAYAVIKGSSLGLEGSLEEINDRGDILALKYFDFDRRGLSRWREGTVQAVFEGKTYNGVLSEAGEVLYYVSEPWHDPNRGAYRWSDGVSVQLQALPNARFEGSVITATAGGFNSLGNAVGFSTDDAETTYMVATQWPPGSVQGLGGQTFYDLPPDTYTPGGMYYFGGFEAWASVNEHSPNFVVSILDTGGLNGEIFINGVFLERWVWDQPQNRILPEDLYSTPWGDWLAGEGENIHVVLPQENGGIVQKPLPMCVGGPDPRLPKTQGWLSRKKANWEDLTGGTWLAFNINDINRHGIAVGSAYNTVTQVYDSLALLPVELVDTKNKILDDGDDVNIEPKATLDEKKDKSIAWIDPHGADDGSDAPDMPQIALRFGGTQTMGLKIKWKLAVKYNRPRGTNPSEQQIRDQDEVYIPKKATGQQEQPWKEEALDGPIEIFNHADWIAALAEKGLFGGEAELKYQLLKADGTALSTETTMLFSIGGKNPEDNLVKQYIDPKARAADSRLERLSYAVAKHESNGYNGTNSRYNQFWEGYGNRFSVDHRKGDPLWCKAKKEKSAGGFGLFQITGNLINQFVIIPREQMWNWRKNVDAYITFVKTGGTASKGSVMDRFIAAVARTYPAENEAQNSPLNYSYDGGNYGAWEMGTVTLYNGAGGYPPRKLKNPAGKLGTFYNPWNYETSRPTGSRWRYYPNENNYLHEVILER